MSRGLLAKPDRDTERLEQIMQLLCCPTPVVPRVAKKDVSKVGHRCSLLNVFTDRRERTHFTGSVNHR